MTKANVFQILTEDHIVEALTKYLRDTPYKLEFDKLIISGVEDDEVHGLKLELLLGKD
jgi:hypothetical protein